MFFCHFLHFPLFSMYFCDIDSLHLKVKGKMRISFDFLQVRVPRVSGFPRSASQTSSCWIIEGGGFITAWCGRLSETCFIHGFIQLSELEVENTQRRRPQLKLRRPWWRDEDRIPFIREDLLSTDAFVLKEMILLIVFYIIAVFKRRNKGCTCGLYFSISASQMFLISTSRRRDSVSRNNKTSRKRIPESALLSSVLRRTCFLLHEESSALSLRGSPMNMILNTRPPPPQRLKTCWGSI